MRLVFMGTPAFAVPALAALLDAGHDVVAVYTQPPRPAHRGQKDTPSPVQVYAESRDITVHTPISLKDAEEQVTFAAHNADAAIVAAYGLLLPKPILDAFPRGCINIHPSLLPRWRGAAPIQRALMAGDRETGVCIMQMDEGLDTGPVLACEHFPIPQEMDAGALHDVLSARGAALLVHTLGELAAGRITAQAQTEAGATYAKKISKEEARIDWSRPAAGIMANVRGLSPAPGATTMLNGESLKIFRTELLPHTRHQPPGTVLDDKLTVACGENALRILELQAPGKKRMSADAFLAGHTVPPNTLLG